MKRTIYTACLMLWGTFSALTSLAQVPYCIEGSHPEGIGKKIYLQYFPAKTPESEVMDSTVVDAKGNFKLAGSLKEMQLLMLTAEGDKGYCVLMGDGKPVKMSLRKVTYNYNHPDAGFQILTDTLEHKAAYAILDYWGHDFMRKMTGGMNEASLRKAIETHNTADSIKYAEVLATAQKADKDEKDNFIAQYGNCLAAPFFIEMNMLKGGTAREMSDFFNRLGPVARSSAKGVQLDKDIKTMLLLAPGAVAPDFTLQTTDGQSLQLSSLRGHIVLIDFWASWCAPCMAEMPTLQKIYAKYKDKGLKILGVSMDNVRGAWVKAIERKQLTWLHVSSLKGMQKCPVAHQYQVYGIPKLYIIDKDGCIVDKDLRGEELEKKIDELFN